MANPTTNYGFVLPTSTDLVTDLPADFDVALQGVDTRLKALQPGTTSGDLAYSSATANTNVRLGIGTTNQVLSVVGGVPAWATPASGGGVTQLATGTLSGASVTISSISGAHKHLQLILFNVTANAAFGFSVQINALTSNYVLQGTTSSFFTGASTEWSYNPAALWKSNNGANGYQMTINNYASASPNGVLANANFSFMQDNDVRFTGQSTMINTSVNAAVTSIKLLTNPSFGAFNGGTYILNGIS